MNSPDYTAEKLKDDAYVARMNETLRNADADRPAAEITFVTTNGQEAVKHDLGRVPNNWTIINQEGTVTLTRTQKDWDRTHAYLTSNAANIVVRVRVF